MNLVGFDAKFGANSLELDAKKMMSLFKNIKSFFKDNKNGKRILSAEISDQTLLV